MLRGSFIFWDQWNCWSAKFSCQSGQVQSGNFSWWSWWSSVSGCSWTCQKIKFVAILPIYFFSFYLLECQCAMEQKSSLGKCTTTRLNDVADLRKRIDTITTLMFIHILYRVQLLLLDTSRFRCCQWSFCSCSEKALRGDSWTCLQWGW